MLVAIVTAVFFLGWQVLPLVYGEREKKILPSLSSPFLLFPFFVPWAASKQASLSRSSLRTDGGRRTNGRTSGRTSRGGGGPEGTSTPPPLSLPGSCEIFASFGRGRQGAGGILPSPFLSRYVEKEAFFSSFGLAASPRSRSAADCFSFGTPLLKSESRRSRNMAAWRRADWEKE